MPPTRTRKSAKPAVVPTTETAWVHPWERAGLGTGPFCCIGYERSVFQAVPGDPNCPCKPGSACDYCGQGIMHVYVIQGADKHTFKVGIDCVLRVQDTAASVAAWKAELRAIRNEPAYKARREAAKAAADARARERTERAEANAAYHPTRKGAPCTLTGTVDKERPHDEHEGTAQTRVSRCKVTDEDTTECVDLF